MRKKGCFQHSGGEATFYDGMIICSTLRKRLETMYGKAEVKTVEGMAAFRFKKWM